MDVMIYNDSFLWIVYFTHFDKVGDAIYFFHGEPRVCYSQWLILVYLTDMTAVVVPGFPIPIK